MGLQYYLDIFSFSFFSLYYQNIIPLLILTKQHDCIKDISKILNMTSENLLLNCLPNIVVYTFPTYCDRLHDKEIDSDGEALLGCLQEYQQMLTAEVKFLFSFMVLWSSGQILYLDAGIQSRYIRISGSSPISSPVLQYSSAFHKYLW